MREIMALEALREAFREEMQNDKRVVLIGEDIGSKWHGAFKVTQGLADEFGEDSDFLNDIGRLRNHHEYTPNSRAH